MQHWNEQILATRGPLMARLARHAEDIRASQQMRFEVFYGERGAKAGAEAEATGLDADPFDAVCDHLLVIDSAAEGQVGLPLAGGRLVGTYRLLRQEVAARHFGFYTQNEFDVAPLIVGKPGLRFLELGRSCVLKPYRNKPVVELLWQGIWNYVRHHRLDVMFGCASFEGADPARHMEALSFLHHYAGVADEWAVAAQASRRVDMNMMAAQSINQRRVLASLPPLIKGYLRLGCSIGRGAVVDTQFNTVDVLIVLPVQNINARYFEHFGAPGEAATVGG